MTRAGQRPVIAIDGPAGVGKSTTARALARELGYLLVDTGALYRGVALAARERGVSWQDGPALGRLAFELTLELRPGGDDGTRLYVNGRDREDDIRTQEIAGGASDVSRHKEVRAALLDTQRELGRQGGVVLEGRDIGTVVFPDAEVKVFLTARPEVRAQRRVGDLRARGNPADYDEILAQIVARDAQDSGRAVAPLKKADDAVEIDSSNLDLPAVVRRIADLARSATPR